MHTDPCLCKRALSGVSRRTGLAPRGFRPNVICPVLAVIATETGEYAMLTATELIEQLSKLPPNSPVYAEGCDCINPVRTAAPLANGCILVAEPDFHGILRFQQDRQLAAQRWEQTSDRRQ